MGIARPPRKSGGYTGPYMRQLEGAKSSALGGRKSNRARTKLRYGNRAPPPQASEPAMKPCAKRRGWGSVLCRFSPNASIMAADRLTVRGSLHGCCRRAAACPGRGAGVLAVPNPRFERPLPGTVIGIRSAERRTSRDDRADNWAGSASRHSGVPEPLRPPRGAGATARA